MAIRRAQRWDTKFGRWIDTYGSRNLANDAGVTVNCVHEWLAGRCSPRLQTAVEIQKLSRGEVRLEDISAHRASLSRS